MENEKNKKINNTTKKTNKTTTQKKGKNIKNNNNNLSNNKNKKSVSVKKVKNETNINSKEELKEDTKKIIDIKKNDIIDNKEEKIKESTKDIIEQEKTNKTGLVVLLAILLIIVGICIFYQIDNKDKEKGSSVSVEESNEIMDDFYKYYNSKKTKIIYYASSSCGYCELENPIMEQIDKDYEIDYLYIDSTKLTKSDREKMLKELDIEHATPTTIVVKDGEILGTQVGYADGTAMVEFLKENKVLDKDAVYTPEQYLTYINYEEYNNLINTEGKNIITIGQTGCSHCIATKPVLSTISKDYNITINYLNITEMSQTERDSFINSLSEIGYDEEEFVSTRNFGTPLTLMIENGKVISYVSGERPTTQFIRAFKKAGFISE